MFTTTFCQNCATCEILCRVYVQRSLYVIGSDLGQRDSAVPEWGPYGVAVNPCATAPVSGTAARNLIARWFAARSPSHVLDQRDGFRRLFDIWANSLPRAPRSWAKSKTESAGAGVAGAMGGSIC